MPDEESQRLPPLQCWKCEGPLDRKEVQKGLVLVFSAESRNYYSIRCPNPECGVRNMFRLEDLLK